MKNLLFVFLLTSFFVSAQDGFEYSILNGDRQRMQGAEELSNGDFVVSNLRSSISWDELSLSLSLLDADGDLKDSIEIEYKDYELASVGIFVVSDSSFLVLGIARKLNENIKRIWVGEFLNNLELVDAKLYGPDNIDYKFTVGHLESDSTLLVTGWAFIPSTIPYVGRIDFVNDSSYVHLNSELTTEPSVFGCFDVIKRVDSVGYVAMGYSDYYVLGDSFKVEAIVNKYNSLESLVGIGNLVSYTDSTYLMTSESLFFSQGDTTAFLLGEIRVSDLSLKRFKVLSLETVPNSIASKPADYINIAKSKVSTDFFVGGTSHFTPSKHYDSKFTLAKFDFNLNKIWEKQYGDDSTYYQMFGVVPTSDGGCLMYGFRVQYFKNYPVEAYVLKVNEEGLITGETIIPMSPQIHVYPNPTKDNIQFDLSRTHQKVQLELVDMSGRVVLAQKISHQESIDISHLPKGMYVCRVTDTKGLLLGTAKILKE